LHDLGIEYNLGLDIRYYIPHQQTRTGVQMNLMLFVNLKLKS